MTIITRNKWKVEMASLYTRLHHGAIDEDPIIIDEIDENDDKVEHEPDNFDVGHGYDAEDNTINE